MGRGQALSNIGSSQYNRDMLSMIGPYLQQDCPVAQGTSPHKRHVRRTEQSNMPRVQQALLLNGRAFEQTRLQLGQTKWLEGYKGTSTTESNPRDDAPRAKLTAATGSRR
jgi:hypothetical protein